MPKGCGCLGFIGGILLLGMIGSLFDGDSSSSSRAASSGNTYRTNSLYTGHAQEETRDVPAATPGGERIEEFYIHGDLNVRSGPGTSYSVLRTLRRGDKARLGPKTSTGWAPYYTSDGRHLGYAYRASDQVRSYAPRAASSGSSSTTRSSAAPRSSAASRGYYRGPRGGCYTYSASGRKRYVDRSLCNN